MSKRSTANFFSDFRTTTLHAVVVTLIGVVLAAVPFYATQYVFAGLMFEKAMLFYSLTTLLILAYLWLLCLDCQYLPKFNLVGWGFLGLMLGWTISTITSPQPYASFWGAFNRMDGLISWVYYFACFVIIVGTLRKSEDWWRVVRFAMAGIGLVVIYGLGQLVHLRIFAMAGERWRVESTLGNPVFLGGYLASALPLALVWMFSLKSIPWRRWSWVFWGLACLTLVFTLSRGSWIAGLIAVSLTITLYCHRYHPAWLKKILIFSTIGAVVFSLVTVGWLLSPKKSWFRQVGEQAVFRSESMIYRQRSWLAGVKAFAQRPLTGWGLENFHIAFDRNYQILDRHAAFTESHVDRAHNEYIGVAAAGGLVALIPYLLMLLYALYRGWLYARSRHDSSDYLLNLGMLGGSGWLCDICIYRLQSDH